MTFDPTLQTVVALNSEQRKQQCPMCLRSRPVREFKLAHVHPIMPPEMYCKSCRDDYGLIDFDENQSSLKPISRDIVPSEKPKALAVTLKMGIEVHSFPDKKRLRAWLRKNGLSIKMADVNTRDNVIFHINPRHLAESVYRYPHDWQFDLEQQANICSKCGQLSPIDLAIQKGDYDPNTGLWVDGTQTYYISGSKRCIHE